MEFFITVIIDRRAYRLKVEQVYIDKVKEQYRISGRNKSIVVESNRPLFRNRRVRHRRPNWKVIEGNVFNSNLDPVYQEILKVVDK